MQNLNVSKSPINKVIYKSLFWFSMLFYFFLFPTFLFNTGLLHILTTNKLFEKNRVYKELDNRLEQLLQYRNSEHYYHAILSKIISIANTKQDPLDYLEKSINNLKQRYPNSFRFIVWDSEGKKIDKLSDEKTYRYIVNTMHQVFSLLFKDAQQNYPGDPTEIDLVISKINILRSYLGNFLIPEQLSLPLLRRTLGEVILASSIPEKSHFWYQINKNFTLFAQLHQDLIDSDEHLKKLVSSLNKNNQTNVVVGIADMINEFEIYPDNTIDNSHEILLELAKYENINKNELETQTYLLSIRMLNQSTRAFAAIKKQLCLTNSDKYSLIILLLFALFLTSLLFYFIYNYVYKTHFLSIRWKLIILFAYANGLPLAILGFIGYEYLQQNRDLLHEQAKQEIAHQFKDFDMRFSSILTDYATLLNDEIDKINETNKANNASDEEITKLKNLALELKADDFAVCDQDEKLRVYFTKNQHGLVFLTTMMKNFIKYFNLKEFVNQERFGIISRGENLAEERKAFADVILTELIFQKIRRITQIQMATRVGLHYWNFLGDFSKQAFNNMILYIWSHNTLQQSYVEANIGQLQINNMTSFAMVEVNGTTYPQNLHINDDIQALFRQTLNLKLIDSDYVNYNNNQYLAYGTRGLNLDKIALVGLYPLSIIENKISVIRRRLILFAFISLFLSTGIATMLSKQFLKPISNIARAVNEIKNQNFKHRLPIDSADEFGLLGKAINSSIESLEELEFAKTVQESLLPQTELTQNNFVVSGKTISMTRLSGDYFDYFELEKNKIAVLNGDVAGHGVPAALLMAMAKGTVLISSKERFSPAIMLKTMHNPIRESRKSVKMMTCQYFVFDTNNGNFLYANAGHCYPIIIRDHGNTIIAIETVGSPLGVLKNPKYFEEEHQLLPGDLLFLYSDGIIEASNSEKVQFGMNRLLQTLKNEFNSNIDIYRDRMFKIIFDWSPTSEDDITMVFIKYNRANSNEN